MNSLSFKKQLLLLWLVFGLWAFIVYIRWLASSEELLFIGTSGLDKIAHLAGGLIMAICWEWRYRRAKFWPMVFFIAAIAFGWEAIELSFDSETRFFYSNAFDLWFLDSLGDIIAALLGGYGFWVFGMSRNSKSRQY